MFFRKSDRALLLLVLQEMRKMNANFQNVQSALDGLTADVAAEDTVIDGAMTLINGIPALIQNAVQQAIAAGGVTSDQLAGFSSLADTIAAKSAALATAVATGPNGSPAANPQTPVAVPPPPATTPPATPSP